MNRIVTPQRDPVKPPRNFEVSYITKLGVRFSAGFEYESDATAEFKKRKEQNAKGLRLMDLSLKGDAALIDSHDGYQNI